MPRAESPFPANVSKQFILIHGEHDLNAVARHQVQICAWPSTRRNVHLAREFAQSDTSGLSRADFVPNRVWNPSHGGALLNAAGGTDAQLEPVGFAATAAEAAIPDRSARAD
jgi:hypothetical protein